MSPTPKDIIRKLSKPATIESMIKYYLMQSKFDGLYNASLGCSCEIEALMCCEEPKISCMAGYKIPCDCPEKCDFHIG